MLHYLSFSGIWMTRPQSKILTVYVSSKFPPNSFSLSTPPSVPWLILCSSHLLVFFLISPFVCICLGLAESEGKEDCRA